MFEQPKAKLSEIEAQIKALVAQIKTERARVDAQITMLEKTAMAPLAQIETDTKKVDQQIVQMIAPLKAQARKLIPPGH